MLPQNIRQQINFLLTLIQDTPNRQLRKKERTDLINSFGISQTVITSDISDHLALLWDGLIETKTAERSNAATITGWLGITTTYKVLPIWERSEIILKEHSKIGLDLPRKMLIAAEDALSNKMTYNELEVKYKGDFYLLPLGLMPHTSQQVFSVIRSAYTTLGIILYGSESDFIINDFARLSCDAYAGTDYNKEGLWASFEIEHLYGMLSNYLTEENAEYFERMQNNNPLELIEELNVSSPVIKSLTLEQRAYLKNYKPFLYSPQKTLEFWEWWLSEAIPQAWELAQQP